MRNHTRALVGLAVVALLAAGCGEAPDSQSSPDATNTGTDGTTSPTAAPVEYTACQITDTGGVDDRSFNESAYRGLQRAQEELGVSPKVLESQNSDDFDPHMQTFLQQGCDMIVTVGFLLGSATAQAAEANPEQRFAIVDFNFATDDGEDVTYENVKELTFQTDEAAFLAGYLAAGMTETGKVGMYGGLEIPTVTIFMDGFTAGVEHHNAEKGTEVEVVGRDLFVGDFESQDKGRQLTDQLLADGADIIMPVAGPVGLGSAAALEDAGEGLLIWVDSDGFESASQFGSLMLTSVMKHIDNALFDVLQQDVDGSFEGGLYVGTLENEGVGLAPFHEFEDDVPQELKDELDTLHAGIISGDIDVSPDA